MPDFVLPPIQDNADGSWGPSTSSVPADFKDIPYAPFQKSDKIHRIADWHDPALDPTGRTRAAYTGGRTRATYGAGEANVFGYVHEEDEKSFSLVDSGKPSSTKNKTSLRPPSTRGRGGPVRGLAGSRGRGAPRGGARGRGGGRYDFNKPQRVRDASVTVKPEWEMLEEIEFGRLAKLNLAVEEPEDLESHGMLQGYDKTFDRINTRTEKPLEVVDRASYNPTTSEDPIIADLASKQSAQVFATDAILAVLMCTTRSVNSWDIVLERRGNQLFLDKRDQGPFDYVTVHENAFDPPADSENPDDYDSAANLSLEATYINTNFSSQVIDDKSKRYSPNPNPFHHADNAQPVASRLYRYRKFDLSVSEDDNMELIVRTAVDAYQGKKDSLVTVKALNEYDARASGNSKALDWRKFLDTQKGAIVASEMKNNSAKLARWAVQSVLAGADAMKMGYISRTDTRDYMHHSIVGVQNYKPRDFAAQMNVSLNNGWGIVRTIADLVLKQPEGKYVLVKDPNAGIIRLYSVPENAFDADAEEEEE